MMKDMVTFIVPTLNEEKNIKDTIDTIEKNIPYNRFDYEILVVDGGSTDSTVMIVQSISEHNKNVSVYADEKIEGLGHAYEKGVHLARGKYVILFPGDNEVSGDTIQIIMSHAGQADIIIPYFTNQQLRSNSRRVISKSYVLLLNLITGLNLRYYNGTVLHKRDIIRKHQFHTAGFAFQAEALIELINSGCTYKEVAASLQKRTSGKTKIFKPKNIISVGTSLLHALWNYRILSVFGKKTPLASNRQDASKSLYSNKEIAILRDYKELQPLAVPESINYIAAFLTLTCNLRCPYCINNMHGSSVKKGIISGQDWVRALNRLTLRPNLPVTLQGGEPTLHRDFYYIIDNLRPDIEIDILTNLQFDVDEFISRVDPERINRDTRFQSIRASYHPGSVNVDETINKALKLQTAGFNIGLGAVMHPTNLIDIEIAKAKAKEAGIVFFTKEYLGFHNGLLFGTYKYPDAISNYVKKSVLCKTTELLIGSCCDIFKCTRDVYLDENPIGSLLDPKYRITDEYKFCYNYGYCNPCDIKVKTNRFLEHGHTSVDIKFI